MPVNANLRKSLRATNPDQPVVPQAGVMRVAVKTLNDIARDVIEEGDYREPVRELKTMRPAKTKDVSRLRMAVAKHLYGVYPVPKHLQDEVWDLRPVNNWENGYNYGQWRGNRTTVVNTRLNREELHTPKTWFKCVASGGSLYKEYAKAYFTKKQVHVFLNVPVDMTFKEALVYAVADGFTDDFGLKTRLAKSKLNEKPLVFFRGVDATEAFHERSKFWQGIIRYFCENPVPINRLNDFVDYISSRDNEWSIKGRTLESLTTQMVQWHRATSREKRFGDYSWSGIPLEDTIYEDEKDKKNNKVNWRFEQILNTKGLAKEGSELHHCVYTYINACRGGNTSIWSLAKQHKGGGSDFSRQITIEVRNFVIVQVRGYANRLADVAERDIIKRWAKDSGLGIRNFGF